MLINNGHLQGLDVTSTPADSSLLDVLRELESEIDLALHHPDIPATNSNRKQSASPAIRSISTPTVLSGSSMTTPSLRTASDSISRTNSYQFSPLLGSRRSSYRYRHTVDGTDLEGISDALSERRTSMSWRHSSGPVIKESPIRSMGRSRGSLQRNRVVHHGKRFSRLPDVSDTDFMNASEELRYIFDRSMSLSPSNIEDHAQPSKRASTQSLPRLVIPMNRRHEPVEVVPQALLQSSTAEEGDPELDFDIDLPTTPILEKETVIPRIPSKSIHRYKNGNQPALRTSVIAPIAVVPDVMNTLPAVAVNSMPQESNTLQKSQNLPLPIQREVNSSPTPPPVPPHRSLRPKPRSISRKPLPNPALNLLTPPLQQVPYEETQESAGITDCYTPIATPSTAGPSPISFCEGVSPQGTGKGEVDHTQLFQNVMSILRSESKRLSLNPQLLSDAGFRYRDNSIISPISRSVSPI